MDIKKLFDYEHALETKRPEFSPEENYTSVMQPEKADEVLSFNLTPGVKEGVFIKFASKDGQQSQMSYFNPVLARSLVQAITQNLAAQGYDIEESANNIPNPDSGTIH